MQDLMANGNYAPYLTQALTPPILGTPGAMGMQGVGPQTGNPTFANPGFGQVGFGPAQGNSFGALPGVGQPGLNPQFAPVQQPQQLAQQQQQIAATLQQLAHHVASHSAIGQQVGATLHQLAQYCTQQVMAGQQFAQLLSQLAQQCAWHAQAARMGGIGVQSAYGGQPWAFGYGVPGAQAWGVNRFI